MKISLHVYEAAVCATSMRFMIAAWIVFAAILFGLVSPAFAQKFKYETVAVPGAFNTILLGINDRGEILGIYQIAEHAEVKPFIFDRGELVDLTIPEECSLNATLWAMNNAREISVSFGEFELSQFKSCVIHDGQATIHEVDRLESINNKGTGAGNQDDRAVIVRRNGEFIPVKEPFGAVQSFATGINDKGHVVGYWRGPDSARRIGFLNVGKKQLILEADDGDTLPYFINNSGIVIGEVAGGEFFHWRKGNFTPINRPESASSWEITGFNSQGKIVGFYFDSDGQAVGFIGIPEGKGKKPRQPRQQ